MDEAFQRRLQAAERGSGTAQATCGLDLMYGLGVAQDQALAHRLLERAHAQGVTVAAVVLADAYRHGWGVAADGVRAAELLDGAADRGHWTALFELGSLYRDGAPGLPADPVRAAGYFARALAHAADDGGWDGTEWVEEARAFLGGRSPAS